MDLPEFERNRVQETRRDFEMGAGGNLEKYGNFFGLFSSGGGGGLYSYKWKHWEPFGRSFFAVMI